MNSQPQKISQSTGDTTRKQSIGTFTQASQLKTAAQKATLFLTDSGRRHIRQVSLDGTLIIRSSPPSEIHFGNDSDYSYGTCSRITSSPDGTLFVTDADKRVWRATLDGTATILCGS